MHAYYGVSQLHSASPTLLETVHQLENSSAIGPGGLYNNNGSMPSNESPMIAPFAVNGTIITSSINSDAAALTTVQSDTSTAPATDMAGYSASSYFPPISTTPNLLFRSPSLYNQGASSVPNNPPLLPPTINSPPIQMAAPTTISPPSSSSWQHTVPVNMPWMSTPYAPTTIKFTAINGRPTVCEAIKNDGMRGPKRRHGEDENGGSEHGGKVHINEERMAARMQELTLDNNNLDWVPDLEESWYASRSPVAGGSQENERNKPCMELVLWKPPGNFVTDVVKNVTGRNSSSLPDQGFSGSSQIGHPSLNSDVWAVEDDSSTSIEVDPSVVPLPDDDDMEL